MLPNKIPKVKKVKNRTQDPMQGSALHVLKEKRNTLN